MFTAKQNFTSPRGHVCTSVCLSPTTSAPVAVAPVRTETTPEWVLEPAVDVTLIGQIVPVVAAVVVVAVAVVAATESRCIVVFRIVTSYSLANSVYTAG